MIQHLFTQGTEQLDLGCHTGPIEADVVVSVDLKGDGPITIPMSSLHSIEVIKR